MSIDNPIGQLRQELARLDCLDTQHAIQIGKLAVCKGESPQSIAASILRHWPSLFVARQD
jgi:hypothetical protein